MTKKKDKSNTHIFFMRNMEFLSVAVGMQLCTLDTIQNYQ